MIKMTTTKHQIVAYMRNRTDELRNQIVRRLMLIGEKCVNDARLSGSYLNQSGNLRGSVGYCVVDRGQIVDVGGFQQVQGGSDGPKNGKAYIEQVAGGVRMDCLVLVVVAGMNYASFVQDRGYNVLQSSEILAEKLVQELITKLAS